MRRPEPVPTECAPDAAVPAGSPPPPWAKRLAWILLGSAPGRFLALGVCRFMSRKLERTRGAPALESRIGVVRLWRIEKSEDVPWLPKQRWALDDGVRLARGDPCRDF